MNKHILDFSEFSINEAIVGEPDRVAYEKYYKEIKKLYPTVYSVLFDKGGDFSKYVGFSNILDVIVNNDKYWIVSRMSLKTMRPFQGKEDGTADDIAVVIGDKTEFDKYKSESNFIPNYITYRSKYPESMIDTVTTIKQLRTPAKINFNNQ